nr:hypothetical protein [Oscillatoria laete-virens]
MGIFLQPSPNHIRPTTQMPAQFARAVKAPVEPSPARLKSGL